MIRHSAAFYDLLRLGCSIDIWVDGFFGYLKNNSFVHGIVCDAIFMYGNYWREFLNASTEVNVYYISNYTAYAKLWNIFHLYTKWCS